MRQHWRYPALLMKWKMCLATIQEWWRCPAPILVERAVDATALEVPSTDNGVDKVPRNDRAVEVSCTDSHGADCF